MAIGVPAIWLFAQALIEGASTLLTASKNKTAQAIGTDVQAIDRVTMAVLQKNAEVKGLTINWNDPTAVQAYVATLPTFVPIPAPAAGKAPNAT
jgi:threonine/homoserine/homoserine lactone efflux protein